MIEQLCSAPPLEALQAFIDYWKSMIVSSDYTAGCPIAAATFGGNEIPGAVDAAKIAFEEWESMLANNFRAANLDDALAQSLSTMTIAAIEGAVIMSVATRSTRPLDRVGKHLTDSSRRISAKITRENLFSATKLTTSPTTDQQQSISPNDAVHTKSNGC